MTLRGNIITVGTRTEHEGPGTSDTTLTPLNSKDFGHSRSRGAGVRRLLLLVFLPVLGMFLAPTPAYAETLPANWSSYSKSGLFACSSTQSVGNFHHQICLTKDTTFHFRALLIVTVTSGNGHWVAVPGVTSIMNTKPDVYRACPTKYFPPGTSLACFSDWRYFPYGAWVQGQGRVDHDGIAGSKYHSPTVQLNE